MIRGWCPGIRRDPWGMIMVVVIGGGMVRGGRGGGERGGRGGMVVISVCVMVMMGRVGWGVGDHEWVC